MRRKRFSALMCAAAVAVSVSPMINVSAEGSVNVKMSADEQEQSVTLVSNEDTNAVLICADRDGNGVLEGMTITDVKLTADTEMVVTKDMGLGAFDDGDKLILVKDLETLQPLSEAVEIGNDAPDETQTATAEPTETASVKPTETITQSPTVGPTETADPEATEVVSQKPTDKPIDMFLSESAVVYQTVREDSAVRVKFLDYGYLLSASILLDPEDPDVSLNITSAEGESMSVYDIQPYDVLDISWDDEWGLSHSSVIDIVVTRNTYTGILELADEDSVTVDGKIFKINYMVYPNDLEPDIEYTLYFNSKEEAVYLEEGRSYKSYGVLWGMSEENGKPMVTVINDSGEVFKAEAKDDTEADKFFTLLMNKEYIEPENEYYLEEYDGGEYTPESYPELLKDDIKNNVFIYDLTDDGKLVYEYTLECNDRGILEYDKDDQKICTYQLSEDDTRMINVEGLLNGTEDRAQIVTLDDLTEYVEYECGLYHKSSGPEGQYRFVIFMDGIGEEPNWDEILSGTGVPIAMYTAAGDDLPTVRMIDVSGVKVEKQVSSKEDADRFFTILSYDGDMSKVDTDEEKLYEYNGETIMREDHESEIIDDLKNNVCRYSVSKDSIGFIEALPLLKEGLAVYNNKDMTLGGMQIDKWTDIIDFNIYTAQNKEDFSLLRSDALEDGADYNVYMYDPDGDGVCESVIVLNGIGVLRRGSNIAIVRDDSFNNAAYNGNKCAVTEVLKDGDIQELYSRPDNNFRAGDIIAYSVGSEGMVENGSSVLLMSGFDEYDWLLGTVIRKNNFSKVLECDRDIFDPETNMVLYGADDYKEVMQYFGVIYRTENDKLYMFNGMENDKSNVADVQVFTIGTDTNIYSFDYEKMSYERAYIESKLPSVGDSIYDKAYTDDTKTVVDWNQVLDNGVEPCLAYVRTVDGITKDVIVYMP